MKDMTKTSRHTASGKWPPPRAAPKGAVRSGKPPERPLLLTPTRASQRLGVSRMTFYRWLRTGYLGAIGVQQAEVLGETGGKRRMFLADSLDRAIARLATAAHAPTATPEGGK